MNLASMRDVNTTDPLPGLGRKVVPEKKPTPEPLPTPLKSNPDVLVNPDGKFETKIPGNGFALDGIVKVHDSKCRVGLVQRPLTAEQRAAGLTYENVRDGWRPAPSYERGKTVDARPFAKWVQVQGRRYDLTKPENEGTWRFGDLNPPITAYIPL